MRRGISVIALVPMLCLAVAQSASADPVNAKNAGFFTAVCGTNELDVVVNGNGVFTPAHVIGSTSVFIPTAFDLTFTFTPSGGGVPGIDTETSAKARPAEQRSYVRPAGCAQHGHVPRGDSRGRRNRHGLLHAGAVSQCECDWR